MDNNVIKQEGRLKIFFILDTTNCNLFFFQLQFRMQKNGINRNIFVLDN